MTTAEQEACHRWSAERLARWQGRPEAMRIAIRYANWSRTDEGMMTMAELSILGWVQVAGKVSRAEHRATIRRIAKSTQIPFADLKIMARAIQETIHCALYGTGQL